MEQLLYDLLVRCTVRISVEGEAGHGTGFFVDHGLVLTCAHVIKKAAGNAASLSVYWQGSAYTASLSELHREADLALLQMQEPGPVEHPCAYLHQEALPFDSLYSYGYPDDHSSGDSATFLLEGRAGERGEQLKFKAGQVRPGMSGAPLLNMRTGHICGIVQLTRDRNNDLGGRAIPATQVFQVFPRLTAQQQSFHRQNRAWVNALWETKYVEGILRRYSAVTLPVDPAQGFSLCAIFQPLALRFDPLKAKQREEQRHLFGESLQVGEEAPVQPVVAENGNDALQKTPGGRMVVLGGPGSGKTTVLKYLISERAAQAIAVASPTLPIFVSLPDFARSGKSLPRYLKEVAEEMGVEEESTHRLWQEVEAGRAFICLDGLDEVEPQRRPHLIALINEWGAHPGNIWVIGSRFTEYKGGQFTRAQFAEWELMPLTPPLRLQLAQQLLPELQRLLVLPGDPSLASGEAFVHLLEQHPQAASWGENPLLFSLAAVVFAQTGGLPSSRTTLYRAVLEAVVEMREPDPLWRRFLLRTLGELALWLQQNRRRTFSHEDLLTFFVDLQHKSIEQSADFASRIITSGAIDVMAHETYGFRHQTFQEYLAAVELARRLTGPDAAARDEAWQLVWSKRTYSRWVEVLCLLSGELVRSGSAGRELAQHWLHALLAERETEDGDPGNLALELALTSLIEVATMPEWHSAKTAKLAETIVSLWIEAVLDSPAHIHVETLAQELSRLPEALAQVVIERSLAALDSLDEEKIRAVTQILKRQEKRVPLQPLLDALQSGKPRLRKMALQLLATQGERVPLELLFQVLREDHEADLDAVEAVIAQGERVPVEPLIQAFHETVSSLVERVLTKMGARVPLEPFLPYLFGNNDYSLWIEAYMIVRGQLERLSLETWLAILRTVDEKKFGPVAFDIQEMGERIPGEMLFNLLQDENTWTRALAAEGLGKRIATLSPQSILDMMRHPDVRVRYAIIDALYLQSERVPLEALLEALHDDDYSVRGAAMAALGKDLPRDELLAGLHHESKQMRLGAIKALVAQGNEANPALLELVIQDQDSWVREKAVEALGLLGEKGLAIPSFLLLKALQDSEQLVRFKALESLKKVSGPVPLEILETVLQDEQIRDSYLVNEAFKVLQDRIPIVALLEQLATNNADSRCAAVYILGAQGEQCPADILHSALRDGAASVRRAAVEVLGIQQRRLSREGLLGALRDEESNVRNTAARALQLLGKDAPVEGVTLILNDQDQGIRRIAAEMCTIQELHVPVEAIISALDHVDKHASWAAAKNGLRLIRVLLIEALAQREEEQAYNALEDALYFDQEDEVRRAAARALCWQEGPPSEKQLEHVINLLHDEDEYERRVAVEILRAYAERGVAVPFELFLSVAREDQEEGPSMAAFDALLADGPESLPPEILEQLLDMIGSGFSTRVRVVEILADRGAYVSHNLLLRILQECALQDEYFWYAEGTIAKALRKLRWHVFPVDLYMQALHLKSDLVRNAAVEGFKAYKEQVPRALLRRHIQDEDEEFQSCVLEILSAYGETLPPEILLTAFFNSDFVAYHERRRRLVRALVGQGARVPPRSLLPGLYHRKSGMRLSTLIILRALKQILSFETLLQLLCDEDSAIVRIAALLLYESYPHLMKPIFDEAAAIVQGRTPGTFLASIAQRSIANAIYTIGYPAPELLDKLTELLRWSHWLVRLKAIDAVKQLRRNIPDEAIRLLLRLRRDPDPLMQQVRDAADEALAEILSLESGIEDDAGTG